MGNKPQKEFLPAPQALTFIAMGKRLQPKHLPRNQFSRKASPIHGGVAI
jgi:hypothetical protein